MEQKIDKSYIGEYYYKKVKNGEISEKEAIDKINESKIKKFIGYKQYREMKKMNLNLKEYINYITQRNEEKVKHIYEEIEKDRIRNKTKIFFNKYCKNIERKCQICNNPKIELHHIDYNDYLKINMLCTKHHKELHKGIIENVEIIHLEKYK